MSAPLPPAVVFTANSPIGLTVVRELGRAGIPVHAVGSTKRSIGLHSRYAASRSIMPPTDAEAGALFARLLGGDGVAIPIGEADALRARRLDEAGLAPGVRMLCASAEALRTVNDKARTFEIAAEAGIDLPFTWQPRADDAIPPELSFPCIAKWADPQAVEPRLRDHGLALEKCEYAFDRDALEAILRRYTPVGAWPLIQSYAPGIGLGQMILMARGRPVLKFQHRRLGEWPATGGVSTLCEALPLDLHAGLFERSIELLRRIGWEGPAMVEYRHDPQTGRSVLMEVNGRFWGSLPLASRAGARFGLATYEALGLGREPPQPAYAAGTRCVYAVPELKRLAALASEGRAAPRRRLGGAGKWTALGHALRDGLRSAGRGYVFSRDDPAPFLRDAAQIAGKILRRRS